jgi:hypothetical protein
LSMISMKTLGRGGCEEEPILERALCWGYTK